jgi:Carboxypeptidase regulatory-like domain
VASTITLAGGKYRLTNLPAPGTYELSFTAPDYQATTVVTTVTGGQIRFQSTVRLSVGDGQIGGLVTDGHQPLGGVAITTTVNGKDVTIGTPTAGTVGSFVIPALPTPGTYVITFSAPGYGAQTSVVQLGPGQSRSDLKVSLAAGAGSVSGQLVDAGGNGLGGATVTVGGAPTTMTSTTLTTGAVGSFSFNALPTPGSYTLTFSLAGYADTTVPVQLSSDGTPPRVRAVLATALGRITGVVTGPDGSPLPGADVVATDGKQSWKSQATGAGGGLAEGGYLLTDLAPGTYTVTASMAGFSQQTALLTVTAGTTVSQNLRLGTGS